MTGTNILIATEKGGSRKTSLASLLMGLALREGLDVAAFEIEQRAELSALFPGRVTHIAMPATEAVLQSDMAEIEALTPVLGALCMPGDGLTLVDVGANLDQRLALCLVQTDMGRRIAGSGRETLAIVPFMPEEASISAAAKSGSRIEQALPDAIVRYCICETGGATDAALASSQIFRTIIKPTMARTGALRLPQLSATALSAMRATGRSPLDLAEMSEEEIGEAAGLGVFVAGSVRSKVLLYVDEVARQFGEFFRRA